MNIQSAVLLAVVLAGMFFALRRAFGTGGCSCGHCVSFKAKRSGFGNDVLSENRTSGHETGEVCGGGSDSGSRSVKSCPHCSKCCGCDAK